MRSERMRNREIEGAIFRYFDREVKNVVVPRPVVPAAVPDSSWRARPMLRGFAVHAAVVALCAGSLFALPAGIRVETPLRAAISKAAREKAYLKLLPSAETWKESAHYFMNRRNKT